MPATTPRARYKRFSASCSDNPRTNCSNLGRFRFARLDRKKYEKPPINNAPATKNDATPNYTPNATLLVTPRTANPPTGTLARQSKRPSAACDIALSRTSVTSPATEPSGNSIEVVATEKRLHLGHRTTRLRYLDVARPVTLLSGGFSGPEKSIWITSFQSFPQSPQCSLADKLALQPLPARTISC